MWLVRIKIEERPLSSRSMELLLSWYRVALLMWKPWFWRKYFVHSTWGGDLCTPTSSLMVEIIVLIFCFLDMLVNPPPYQSLWWLLCDPWGQGGCHRTRWPTSVRNWGHHCWRVGPFTPWYQRDISWGGITSSSCPHLEFRLGLLRTI